MFIVDRVSFEELLEVPQVRALAVAGGAGLMATHPTIRDGPAVGVYRSLANGSNAEAAEGGAAVRALDRGGAQACAVPTTNVGMMFQLVPGEEDFPVPCGGPAATIPDRTFPGGSRTDPMHVAVAAGRGLAGYGVVFVDLGDTRSVDVEAPFSASAASAEFRADALTRAGELIEDVLDGAPDEPTLVMVVAPSPSFGMQLVGDEVTPVVMAIGPPRRLLDAEGEPRSLTSATTRRGGLVANVDVAPTLLRFFGVEVPPEMDGSAIETSSAGAPFGLHRRHLEQRRARLPVQIGALVVIVVAFVAATAAVLAAGRGWRPSARVSTALRFVYLVAVAVPLVLWAAGSLPRLSYAVVVPFLVLMTIAVAFSSTIVRTPGPFGPLVFIALVTLGFVVLDAALGGRSLPTPLLGSTALDGGRFYGVHNAYLPVLMASGLFVAATLDPLRGTLVLVAVGLFAGLPHLGADVGGCIAMFFAAGLWWVLRTRTRFRVKELAFVAGTVALGLGVVLLLNRLLPGTRTHAGRFAGRTSGPGDALSTLARRLEVGIEQLVEAPVVCLALIGLLWTLILALRPPDAVAGGFALQPTWRLVVVVLVAASVVAFFANDTGAAAAAPAFLFSLATVAYGTVAAATRDAPT